MERSIDDILALLSHISNPSEKLKVIATLLKISGDNQQLLSLGFDIIDTIHDDMERILSLLRLAIAVRDMDIELYKGLIQMAINGTEKIANPKYKAMVLPDVAIEAVTFNEDLALKLIEEVLNLILRIDLREDRIVAVMHLLETLLKSENIEGAIKVAEKISDPYYKAIVFSEIGKVLAEAQIPLYSLMFSKALKSAAEIDNMMTREITFGEVISRLAEAGEVDESLKLAEKLKVEDARMHVIESAFLGLLKKGDLSRVSELMSMIKDRKRISKLWALSVSTLMKEGYYEKVLEIINNITDPIHKDLALNNMSVALAEKGEFKKALLVVKHIKSSYFRGNAFSLIGLELFNKDVDGYNLLFEKAIEEAENIDNVELRSKLFLDITLRLITVNLREHLLEFFNRKNKNAEKSIKEGNLEKAAREYKEGLELSEIARLREYSENFKEKIYEIRRKLVERVEIS